ncbi:MAG: hypothetical protein ABIQ62_05345 [Thermomonas sp.]
MTLRQTTLRSCIVLLLTTTAAAPILAKDHSVSGNGLPPTPTNAIVGTWNSDISLSPCAGGPVLVSFKALGTYHAGGTLSDTNNTPSALRTAGHGIWQYVGGGEYKTRFQIFRFLPVTGAYDGYADVHTVTTLVGPNQFTTTVLATNYNPNGTFRNELCGSGSGSRLSID